MHEEMRIGELARRTGVSTRSLRYYEQQGLLVAERADNGYRAYDERAATRVANIRVLLDSGWTLDAIRGSMADDCLDEPLPWQTIASCPHAMRAATQRLAALEARIEGLQVLRDRLATEIARARGGAL